MPVQRKTKSVGDVMRTVHNYLFYRGEEQRAKKQKEKAYTPAKADTSLIPQTIKALGEEDADGSYWWYFDEPLEVHAGTKHTGLKWQRSTGEPYIDPDKAQALAKRKGVEYAVSTPTLVLTGATAEQVSELALAAKDLGIPVRVEFDWDYDEFYTLRQRKLITEKELESLLVVPEARFSLVVLND